MRQFFNLTIVLLMHEGWKVMHWYYILHHFLFLEKLDY